MGTNIFDKIKDIAKNVAVYMTHILGGVLGVMQGILKTISECCMLFIWILSPLLRLPRMPKNADGRAIAKIKEITDKMMAFLEKCRNWLFGLGFKA